jgi:hypothetical protein
MGDLGIRVRAKLTLFAAVFAVLLAAPRPVAALSGKDKVASRGKPAKALPGWPEGVMKLINHRLRTDGWNSWFSELPNDMNYYGMDVRGMDDVNALLKLLAAVKAKHVVLNFDPAAGGRHVGGAGGVFAIGNQPILDRWFKQLPVVAPGVRRFGLHRHRKPPTAQPPTLTVYTGSKWFDWKKLKVPLKVEVTTATAAAYRERYEEQFETIDKFIERHNARRRAVQKNKSR